MCFSPYVGIWCRGGGGGGGSQGIGTQLLMQFFTVDNSKIKVLETFFLIL